VSENKKFILVTLMILIIFAGEKIYRKIEDKSEKSKKNYVVKMEKHTYNQVDELLDINNANLEEMLQNKVSMGYGKKIIEYRNVTGGFKDLKELMKISGIGKKTYEKLSSKFQITTVVQKKSININSATDTELYYYGFSKGDIKKIRAYQRDRGRIFDNIALLGIVGEKVYEEIGSYIKY